MKFRRFNATLNEQILLEGNNNKTLKLALLSIAHVLTNIPYTDNPELWQVHHWDGNDDNNDLDNLCLMRSGSHQRFHNESKGMTPQEKQNLINTKYSNQYVRIGKILSDLAWREGINSEGI